ncbi:MAG TPA: protein kinase, partial [Kofleriaceae bacterium]|nr:protein kinase [Kofleriaceae bacterium]
MSCPAPDRVLDYLAHAIDASERDAIDAHVDQCAACRKLLVQVALDDDLPRAIVDDPAMIGRYQVTSRLGDGGMGTVFAAYDPQLDRRVAVKLVHPELAERGGLDRLLREGRALAKLAHPNVVSVYDADTDGNRVYVAMELVAGDTLAAWLRKPRSWREIAAKFVAAGRGIAAAHRAGIIHRDVKPENILVDHEGNAKVADFGLAGHSDAPPADLPGSVDSRLTQPGAVMGTPMFMSPEQKAGLEVGPATDQYSLCAALADALRETRIPRWLQRAIAHGMAPRPADRFVSIDALVAAIDPARRRRRGRWIALAAAIGVATAGGIVAYATTRSNDGFAAACEGAVVDNDVVWPEMKQGVHAAFAGNAKLIAAIDDAVVHQVRGQKRVRDKLCDQRPNSDSTHEVFELGMACLADRRDTLRALLGDLEQHPDPFRAVERIHTLPGLDDCTNAATLRAEHAAQLAPGGPAKRQLLRDELAAMKKAFDDGHFDDARVHEHKAVDIARTFGGAILARTLVDASHTSAAVDDFHTMETWVREAATLAEAAQADDVRAFALSDLMAALAHQPNREKEALAMRPLVEAVLARGGGKVGLAPVVAQSAGVAYLRLGQIDDAVASFKESLELVRKLLPKDDRRLPDYIYPVGVALAYARRDAAAAAYHAEAYEVASRIWGPDHPNAVRYQIHLAFRHGALGDCGTAIAEAEHARGILMAAMPPHAPENLQATEIIGTCEMMLHQYEAALREHRKRVDSLAKHGAANSVETAGAFVDIGDVEVRQGKVTQAIADYSRAVTLIETIVGIGDERLATPLTQRGIAEVTANNRTGAIADLER